MERVPTLYWDAESWYGPWAESSTSSRQWVYMDPDTGRLEWRVQFGRAST